MEAPMVGAFRVLLLAAAFPLADQENSTRTGGLAYEGPPAPTPPEVVSRDGEGRVTVRAVRLDEPLVLDGVLDDRIYTSVTAIGGFIQQEPHEGEQATEKTDAWLLFDRENIYVAARCWDSSPERMVANEMRRDDFNLFFNENFAVIFDTFYDRRNGFQFQTNPLGGLADSYITDEKDVNRDWNTVWEVRTGRFASGWTVEMAIPFKSLRYRAGGDQLWGVNFRRIVRWKNETSYLTPIPASFSMGGLIRVSSAATLVGLQVPPSSRNLELKPYGIGGIRTDVEADPPFANQGSGDAGFDLKYGLTKGLTADFTYNTDFAQVEADEQQVNLTRFSLFFPEKREFFLEGQGIFTFGGPRPPPWEGPSSAPVVFFSRRIGLAEGRAIPISAGGRISGRAGDYSLGLLNIRTAASDRAGVEPTTFSVLRLKRNILRRSNLGVMATRRSPSVEGPGANQVYGVDTSLSFYENVSLSGYYARSKTPGLDGDPSSYRARLEYAGDRFGGELDHLLVGDGFNPEIGFVSRDDFRRSFAYFRFSPRPKSLRAVRKIGWEASLDYTTDLGGRPTTREARLSHGYEFQNGDSVRVSYSRNFEFLTEDFEIADGIAIPVGGYRFQGVNGVYEIGPQRPLTGWVFFDHGSFFSGKRTGINYIGRIEVSPQLSLEPRLSVNWVRLAEGRFVAQLLGGRVNYTISPRSFIAALVQYNSSNDSLGVNARFRWEYRPGSDLFVVYSDGRDTLGPGFPKLVNRSLVVKLTRLVRF
jgi:hypothetical protein